MRQGNLLYKLSHTGIYPDTPIHLKNKLTVFNNAMLVVITINLFYDLIGIYHGYYVAVAMTTMVLVMGVFVFFLNRAKKYNIAFHFIMWYAFVFLSGFTFLFGGANSSYFFLMFIPVACNILFDNWPTTILYMLGGAIIMMLNIHWFNHHKPYYDIEEWMSYFSYPNMFFAVLLIYLGVRLFKTENIKYAKTIDEQRKALEEKNKEITDSINYAKKIQSALIPSEQSFAAHFTESFVLFRPKDIVSGDFYWAHKTDASVFYATADCTGHGVPGGFMTMLGISFLDEIIGEKKITSPAEVLNSLRDRIIHTLKQSGQSGESKDGMDIVICRMDLSSQKLTYAAANNSLYMVRQGEMSEMKPDKQPCGFHHEMSPFKETEIQLLKGDRIYTFTDGLADQFGGPKGKKYKYKQLEQLIMSAQSKSFDEQKQIIEKSFDDWKGNLEQIDDVCVIGIGV
jgi:serine phosphatase RsbU (regulator of sigma subunit)